MPSATFARWTHAATAAACFVLGSAQLIAAPPLHQRQLVAKGVSQAPTDAFCRSFGFACYSPQEMYTAYGLNGLISSGFVGAGQTIVIIDSYGSPTIAADLAAFDEGYGLPAPPSLTVLSPLGAVPFDPAVYPDQVGWALETTLDLEWAHAMAPGASIVLLTSPVDETEGVQGLPEFLALEKYALDHHLGQIMSQSWSATENTLFLNTAGPAGPQVVAEYLAFHQRAAAEHVTLLAASGDYGSSNYESDYVTFYPYPTVGFPASSPWVTGVGGTSLYADTSGNYQYETVWNDAGCCAGGGGISQLFKAPDYQRFFLPGSTLRELGGMRGVPDVSYNAGCYNNNILIYLSFLGADNAGWYGICGTSNSTPQWAGIIADLNQYAGRPLGFLNPALYAVGGLGLWGSFGRDITQGNNALLDVPGIVAPGYSAGPGWDPASGWGTPNFVQLPYQQLELLQH